MLKQVFLFGFQFTGSNSLDETADWIANYPKSLTTGKHPFLITPNVDDVVNWTKDEYQSLRKYFENSSYIIPDGQPLVVFSKLIGKSLIQRITGSTIFPLIWQRVKQKKQKAFLILANEQLCKFYENEYPLARAFHPPFFSKDDETMINTIVSQCLEIIESHQPEFVFVGIQFPKQNILALELYKRLDKQRRSPLFLILGSSMEYYAGFLKRSPRFVQVIGMEWFYRFIQQPKRLFKRYFVNDVKIISIFIKEAFKGQRQNIQ
jgi:N-acetylglucosaminyldiphosphoundecaprenol N-acetyl-beta-D-mannosaminyltransferase